MVDHTRRKFLATTGTGLAALAGCLGGGNGNGSTQEEESATPGPDTPVTDGNPSGNSNLSSKEYTSRELDFLNFNFDGETMNAGVNAKQKLNSDLENVNEGLVKSYASINGIEGFDEIEDPFFEEGSAEIIYSKLETETEADRWRATAKSTTSQETNFRNFNQVDEENHYKEAIAAGIGTIMIHPVGNLITDSFGPNFSSHAREPDQEAIQEMHYILEDQNGNSEEVMIKEEEIDNLEEYFWDNALAGLGKQIEELGAVANYKREGNSLADI